MFESLLVASNVCALKFVSLKGKQSCKGEVNGHNLCVHFRTLPQSVMIVYIPVCHQEDKS